METVIFGASKFGEAALRDLKNDFNIRFFCDNSKEKQGRQFCGLEVISPCELFGKKVIIASYYSLEIIKQLLEMGIADFYVAFDNGKGTIDTGLIKLSQYESLNTNSRKICLVCEDNSGSNTFAIGKLAENREYEFVSVNERHKDSLYYYHILTSRAVIRTHGGSILDNTVNIQLWHGIGLKPLGYMRKGASMLNEPKHMTWLKLDAVFSYSQMYNLILSACFGVPETKFYITGAPRNDFLFKTNGRSILSDIISLSSNRKKLILYAPTYRENVYGYKTGSTPAYLYDMDGFDPYEFDSFLEECNYQMVLKLHPYDMENASEKISGLKNITLLTDAALYEKNLDFYEVLNAFDCLISDYSSLASDFLLLDRPIVYMPLDIDEYRENVGFLLEPYDFWCPGEKVYDYKALKQTLTKIFIEDNYSSGRELLRSIFHKYTDGESTKRVLDTLESLLNNKPAD